jgi:transcriptional regulator with XRE-family HTH domain
MHANGYRHIPNIHPILQRLQQYRIIANYSQTYVAVAIGATTAQISNIERSTRAVPFYRVAEYAQFLGYDLVLVPRRPQ